MATSMATAATMPPPTTQEAQQTQQDGFEPNDGFENATALDPGTYTGLESTKNDLDVYAVDVVAGESLSAAISFSHAEGDLDLFLLGPDQTTRQVSDSTTDGENISYVAGETGTHYLVVVGFEGATAPYSLSVSVTDDKGETLPGN
jgi:type II secretory pathway pseudopilin PulG